MTQPSQPIVVDLGQLRETYQAVKRDTEQGLRPGLRATDQKIHQGVPFGRRSPSGEVDAAAKALTYALKRYARNSVSHLQRAEQIATFLDIVLLEYANADALTALNVEAILDRLNEAVPPVPRSHPSTGVQP